MVTTGQTVMRYVNERRQRGEFAPDTVTTIRSVLYRFAAVVGNDLPMARLDKRHVRRWWSTLTVGPSSSRNQLSAVRTFLRWAVEEDLLRSDPSRGMKPPKEPRRVPRTLQQPVASVLVNKLPDSRARLMVLWMLHLGLRCGEMARVQLGDVDFASRLLVVRGKGGNERVLPIPTEAWCALLSYLEEHPAVAGPLVRRFDRPHEPLQPKSVSTLMGKLMRDAGVKTAAYDGISAHACRRTCASDMLDRGANLRQVQEALGHADLGTVQRYLRRQTGVDLRSVMEGRCYR